MDKDASKAIEGYQAARLHAQQIPIVTGTGTWMNATTASGTGPAINTSISVKNALREVLENHKRRIEAIEWFIIHLGLDEPPAGSLVNDIIYAGIQALEQRKII